MYKIKDEQLPGRYFSDGKEFESLDEIRRMLVSYHEIDSDSPTMLARMSLSELLEYGSWGLEKDGEDIVI